MLVTHDAELHAVDRSPRALGDEVERVAGACDRADAGRLGEPVPRVHPLEAQRREHAAEQRGRDHRGPRDRDAQRVGCAAPHVHLVEQRSEDRGRALQDGRALRFDEVEQRGRAEAGDRERGRARDQAREGARLVAADVRHRADHRIAVERTEPDDRDPRATSSRPSRRGREAHPSGVPSCRR